MPGGAPPHEALDSRPMDPRDRPNPFANGVDCAVCGRLVPLDRIRVLAQRDDLTFVEVACTECRSETLGIVVASDADGGGGYGEFLAADDARFREALPIDVDDILVVRDLLAKGDLDAFVRRPGDAPTAGSGA
jgi:hypothetical protein